MQEGLHASSGTAFRTEAQSAVPFTNLKLVQPPQPFQVHFLAQMFVLLAQ